MERMLRYCGIGGVKDLIETSRDHLRQFSNLKVVYACAHIWVGVGADQGSSSCELDETLSASGYDSLVIWRIDGDIGRAACPGYSHGYYLVKGRVCRRHEEDKLCRLHLVPSDANSEPSIFREASDELHLGHRLVQEGSHRYLVVALIAKLERVKFGKG